MLSVVSSRSCYCKCNHFANIKSALHKHSRKQSVIVTSLGNGVNHYFILKKIWNGKYRNLTFATKKFLDHVNVLVWIYDHHPKPVFFKGKKQHKHDPTDSEMFQTRVFNLWLFQTLLLFGRWKQSKRKISTKINQSTCRFPFIHKTSQRYEIQSRCVWNWIIECELFPEVCINTNKPHSIFSILSSISE